ncbi:hypothetical protein B0H13DRAFT_1994665 [Mycena leptocephala]|nr:hypothetical protein B0H13DRAFT_1994665 [Mycena leptocephala]
MILDKTLDLTNGDAPPAYEARVSNPCPTSWFNFPSPTSRQVRATLQPTDHSFCVDACAANGLSISTVLQEKSRPAESAVDENLDLLTALLALSTPLTPATVSDVRLACLLMSDQALFQQLRASPEFAPMSATDEMLLDATMPPDAILVENMPGHAGAFAVDFAIVRFQKRMHVVHRRGRMWRLSFNVSTQDRLHHPRRGTWYAALSLMTVAPDVDDSRLLITAPLEPDTKQQQFSGPLGLWGGKARPRPTLSVRIKAKEQLEARLAKPETECIIC